MIVNEIDIAGITSLETKGGIKPGQNAFDFHHQVWANAAAIVSIKKPLQPTVRKIADHATARNVK